MSTNKPKRNTKSSVKQQKVVQDPSQGRSRRRRNRNRNKNSKMKDKPITRVQAQERGFLVTPVQSLEIAAGVVKEISVTVPIDANSFLGIWIAQISLAQVRGQSMPYAAYQAYYSDLYSLATSGVGTAITRLQYFNDILADIVPKNVPFRDGSIYFSWTNLPGLPGPALPAVGGLYYYMYVNEGAFLGVWATQVAPPVYGPGDITNTYVKYIDALAGNRQHNKAVRDVPLGARYKNDASAFARASAYYGRGIGVGAPYESVELEVVFKSNMLATLVSYMPMQPRSSRYLSYSSGDSCSNWGIGALDVWNTSFYDGAVAPIYKFLDLNEVSHLLISALVEALQNYVNKNPELSSYTIGQLTGGLGCTWSQWLIMLRQQILWMFADSQCIAQCLSPQVATGAFTAFLCGSNCFPAMPSVLLNVPIVINENLKMLKMCLRPYQTKNFNSPRNHITHIPVWGTFAGNEPEQYFYVLYDNPIPVFLPEIDDPYTPNLFDGHGPSGQVIDFNLSPILPAITANWNQLIQITTEMWGGLTSLGGDSNASPLLQFTRYVTFPQLSREKREIRGIRMPRYMERFIKEVDVEEPAKLERKNSKPEVVKKKVKVWSPADSTIFTEYTSSISSLIPITQTHRQYFEVLIIPVIELDPAPLLPSQAQVQTSSIEPYSIAGVDPLPTNSRGSELMNAVINLVVGLAGKSTELMTFIEQLTRQNQGSLLGDLFSAVGSSLPGEAGAVVSTIGKVASFVGV